MKFLACSKGQATIEVLGMVPIVATTCLVLAQSVLLAGFAMHADRASHAATLADSQGRSASLAARRAIPDWARGKVAVSSTDRILRVTLSPKSMIPGLDRLVTTQASYERRSR